MEPLGSEQSHAPPDLRSPHLYSFVDVSQNNHQTGQTHWDNMQVARRLVADPPRPMNNVKIYGGERHGGGLVEGTHKLWRSILGGCASARFHRPGRQHGYYGAGLNERAQTHLRSARMFVQEFDVFAAEPNNGLLSDRQENEAYCAADPGNQYAIYFPDGGSVELDLRKHPGRYALRWIDIATGEWAGTKEVAGGTVATIAAPKKGHWLAVLVRQGN